MSGVDVVVTGLHVGYSSDKSYPVIIWYIQSLWFKHVPKYRSNTCFYTRFDTFYYEFLNDCIQAFCYINFWKNGCGQFPATAKIIGLFSFLIKFFFSNLNPNSFTFKLIAASLSVITFGISALAVTTVGNKAKHFWLKDQNLFKYDNFQGLLLSVKPFISPIWINNKDCTSLCILYFVHNKLRIP